MYRGWQRTAKSIRSAAVKLPGVEAEVFAPEIANQCPHVRVRWNSSQYSVSPDILLQKMRDGEPSVELVPAPTILGTIEIASWMLQPGEADIISRRIREILTGGV
jgi:L-seryl-tRNA(Ser) seleniumtransferase